MKTLSILSYIVGSVLLILSCFTESVALTWWFGALAVAFLILGCVFQFNSKTKMHAHGYVSHRDGYGRK